MTLNLELTKTTLEARATKNDDDSTHNLSLINVIGNSANEINVYREVEKGENIFIQKQVWGVMDAEDVEKQVNEFLEDIDFQNSSNN